jgi:two-component system, OmpR family, sensor kinase
VKVAGPVAAVRRWLRRLGRHRPSLRARLLAALLGTLLVVLAVVDTATLSAIRSFLLERIDHSLARANRIAQNSVTGAALTPSLQPNLTAGRYYVGVATADGRVRALLSDPATVGNPPRLRGKLAGTTPDPRTVAATSGGAPYRVVVTAMPGQPGAYLVVGISLEEYEAASGRITTDLVAGAAAAFVVLALAGWALTRHGLRPLERIADKADTVTGGDLSTRMEIGSATSEVGRMSTALNSMLERIEESVRERDAVQQRIRTFMADASHELRTPLTTVRSYAELYEQGALADSAAVATAMHRIASEAARMSDLVGQLLTLARFDEQVAPARRPVDLSAVVCEAVADARAVEPRRPISIHTGAAPVWVDGDPTQLIMMTSNLLANVRMHAGPAADVTVTVTHSDARCVLEVGDSGPGVPPEALSRLFDRFYRAPTNEQRSSGLGLAIVAAIAEAHGGQVRASLRRPTGLAIRVDIPEAGTVPTNFPSD